MIVPVGVEIFVAAEPVDMRLGFERLGALVRERMRREPRSRALFVFVGRKRQTVRVLSWTARAWCSSTSDSTADSSRCRGPSGPGKRRSR